MKIRRRRAPSRRNIGCKGFGAATSWGVRLVCMTLGSDSYVTKRMLIKKKVTKAQDMVIRQHGGEPSVNLQTSLAPGCCLHQLWSTMPM